MAANPRLIALLKTLEISPEYSEAALAEAKALAEAPGIDDPALVDRLSIPFCTIDEPHSKDLDQALCVESLGASRGFRLWYAIADAAHFVRPGSALWDEALLRGASYYMPGLVIPMLPKVLSEGVVSLNPQVDRRALLFELEIDARGRIVGRNIERARVRSRAKLSYQGVQAWYDNVGAPHCDAQVQRSLRALEQMGRLRIQLAQERGVVPFRRREVDLKAQGGRIVAYEDMRRDVERYNEQLSLMCNVEGARFLRKAASEIHPIYRVHPAPDRARLDTLRRRVDQMIKHWGLDPKTWAWDGQPETFADWLAALPKEGEHASLAQVIHRQAVVSSGRAAFTSLPGVHHGIGADVYGRFTAPMREIVGIYLHGEAGEQLGGPDCGPEQVAAAQSLRDEVIAAAERAANHQKALDREANRIVLDQVMHQDHRCGGISRRGVVMGMSRRKIYVRLQEPPLDIKVYLHHLESQRGRRLGVDAQEVQLLAGDRALFTLGDEIVLRVMGEDTDADRWIFHAWGVQETIPEINPVARNRSKPRG